MIWRRQYGFEWKESPQAKLVDFYDLDLATPRYVMRPYEWPEHLRWMVEAFLADRDRWMRNDQVHGGRHIYMTPRFFLGHQRKLVAVSVRSGGWVYEILPALEKVLKA